MEASPHVGTVCEDLLCESQGEGKSPIVTCRDLSWSRGALRSYDRSPIRSVWVSNIGLGTCGWGWCVRLCLTGVVRASSLGA